MASGLPQDNRCCDPCDTAPDLVGPQGPTGATGAAGANGTNGVNAYTTLTAGFTQPASGANVTIAVASTAWMVATENLYIAGGGYYEIQSIGSAVAATIKNLGYTENVAPTTAVANGQKVVASGVRGSAGATGVSTLNGVSPTTTKGDIIVDNGATSPVASDIRLGVGTNGQALVADSTAPSGLSYKTITPNTAATDRSIAVANGTAVSPMPLQFVPLVVTVDGDIRTTGANARGAHAVDLQSQRVGVAQVASGTNSFVAGGTSNTASATNSTVGGGAGNTSSGAAATVAGGFGNVASGDYSGVSTGFQNSSTNTDAFVGGGNQNVASGADSMVGAGTFNSASGASSGVAAGTLNTSSGAEAFVGGGNTNVASGAASSVGGGTNNTASGTNSNIPGGVNALADKFGQVAHAATAFATQGDAQTSEYIYSNATTDGTQTELYLDGTAATLRAFLNTSFAWCFSGILIGRRSNGDCATWEFKGGIKNNAGTVSLIGTCTPALIMADAGSGGSWGVAGSIVVDADNGNKTLRIRVTGTAANNIRWVAHVRTVETKY